MDVRAHQRLHPTQPSNQSLHYEIKTIEDMAMVDQVLRDESVKFLNQSIDAKKPFFLIHSFSKIHNDNYVAPKYKGASPAAMPVRDAMVEVDAITGEIMDVLEKKGVLENTLVFLTSDNGANEDTWPDSGYHPWRGGKGTTWEGGVRVPGIAYWKGMIEPGQINNGLMNLTDVYMTCLRLGGVMEKLPDNL